MRRLLAKLLKKVFEKSPENPGDFFRMKSHQELVFIAVDYQDQIGKLNARIAELKAVAEANQKSEQVWRAQVALLYETSVRNSAQVIYEQEAASRGLAQLKAGITDGPK